MWPAFAAALCKLIFPLGSVRSAGIGVAGSNSSFTNGLNVLLGLANNPHHPHPLGASALPPERTILGVHAGRQQEAATYALANVLQHRSLTPLWTTEPERLAYLIKLEEEQIARVLMLPAQLKAREQP